MALLFIYDIILLRMGKRLLELSTKSPFSCGRGILERSF